MPPPTIPYATSTTSFVTNSEQALCGVLAVFVLLLCFAAPTYIIIYLLSHFDAKHSTTAQRGWIIASLAGTSASWMGVITLNNVVHFLNPPRDDGTTLPAGISLRELRILVPNLSILLILRYVYLSLLFVPSVGAFVIVGKMIMESETCVRI
jgi:chromate transport protein ChrA